MEDEVEVCDDNTKPSRCGGGGREQDFADMWIQRASSFNNVCNRFSRLCDKFTFIPNRELFFDINSYLNNLQERHPFKFESFYTINLLINQLID